MIFLCLFSKAVLGVWGCKCLNEGFGFNLYPTPVKRQPLWFTGEHLCEFCTANRSTRIGHFRQMYQKLLRKKLIRQFTLPYGRRREQQASKSVLCLSVHLPSSKKKKSFSFKDFIPCSGYFIHGTCFSESLNQKIILMFKDVSPVLIAMKKNLQLMPNTHI